MTILNNSLVLVKNNQPVTSSKIVAAVFKKRHGDVMRAIRNLKNGVRKIAHPSTMFVKSTITKDYQHFPIYYMNRDGFSLLVMGFTGKMALTFKLDFIHAFNQMEQKLKQKLTINSPKSAWMLQAYKQQKYLENVKPKVDYYNKILGSKDTAPISIASKRFGLTPNALNLILWRHGIQFKQGKTWYLTSKYQSKGFAKHVPYYVSEYHTAYNLKWFAKGLKFITEFLLKNGYEIVK